MNNRFTRQLKDLVADFTDDKGNILEQPKGRFVRKKLDGRRISFLRRFIDLLLNTKFTSKETKYYISNKYITMEGVVEELAQEGKKASVDSVSSRVWYDKNKIISWFGEKVIVDMTEYSNINIDEYEKKLEAAISKYGGKKINDYLAIKLPEGRYEGKISDEQFTKLLELLKPYTKKYMKNLAKSIPAGHIGYLMYILSSNILDDEDLRRRHELCSMLEGEPED